MEFFMVKRFLSRRYPYMIIKELNIKSGYLNIILKGIVSGIGICYSSSSNGLPHNRGLNIILKELKKKKIKVYEPEIKVLLKSFEDGTLKSRVLKRGHYLKIPYYLVEILQVIADLVEREPKILKICCNYCARNHIEEKDRYYKKIIIKQHFESIRGNEERLKSEYKDYAFSMISALSKFQNKLQKV